MPDEQRLEAIRHRLVALLDVLSADWTPVSDTVVLYLLCGGGLAELQFSGRAWTSASALDFEATVSGVWIDAERKSILPDALRHAVPAWAQSAVAVQLNPIIKARLTSHGEAAKSELCTHGEWLFLEYICSHLVRGRVTVRIIGNEGPAPGGVSQDTMLGDIAKALQGIERAQQTMAAAVVPTAAEPAAGLRRWEERIVQATKLVVGGKATPGVSRLINIADSNATVETKLQHMARTGLLRPDVSASALAAVLGVNPASVKKTRWWRNHMANRRQAQADAEAPYVRKYGPRRRRWH